MEFRAALAKIAISRRVSCAGEFTDCAFGCVAVGVQIEARAVAPGVAREDVGGHQIEFVVEAQARVPEQGFEHPAHGEDGGSGVDRRALHIERTHFSAGCGGALEHRDGVTEPCEIRGGGESAHAGADDDDATHAARDTVR